MKNNKKGSLGVILGALVVFIVLKNLLPALVGLFKFLIGIASLAFVVLLIAIIISGLKSGEKEAQQSPDANKKELTADEKKALDTTKSAVTRIRIASARVNDAEIRNAFTASCDKTEKILNYLKKDPEDFQTGRRVINYYTSSIEEIENKFIKLQDSGTDIADTPDKLKANLAEINSALDKLYNNLFANDKLDLTVEMKALSIALKRDGLVDDGFAKIAEEFSLGNEEEVSGEAENAEA